jgi:hypothetical protein
VRLRAVIAEELARRGIVAPRAVGDALGMTPLAALELLQREHWREGDLARLRAAAARLGLA